VVLHTCQNGLDFIGHHILEDLKQKYVGKETGVAFAMFMSPFNLLKATEEFSCLFAKYVFLSCKNCSNSAYWYTDYVASEGRPCWLAAWGFSNQGIAYSFWYVKAMLRLFLCSSSERCLMLFNILDLFLCHLLFALAWLMGNSRSLILAVRPILMALISGGSAYDTQIKNSLELLAQVLELLTPNLHAAEFGMEVGINGQKLEQIEVPPDDLIRHIAHSSFWMHVSGFLTDQVVRLSTSADAIEQDSNKLIAIRTISNSLTDFLKISCSNVSFYCSKQFALCLLQKANISGIANLLQSEDFLARLEAVGSYKINKNMKWMDSDDNLLGFESLLKMFTDPEVIHGDILREYRI
ncbi:hypothetical protein M569_08396, partial [Genlisea aurea]